MRHHWRQSKAVNRTTERMKTSVSSKALVTINVALTDKRDLSGAISSVIATKRKTSYVRAVQKDSYLIPSTAKIGLMLDRSCVAFDLARQQRFEMWRD